MGETRKGRSRPREAAPSTWVSYRQAAGMFLRGVTVPTSTPIALVVGTWLSLMNQGRLVLDGHPPWIKLALNFLTPFTVASLGFLAGRRQRTIERLADLLRDNSRGRSGEDTKR